jgi:hypothetical protein
VSGGYIRYDSWVSVVFVFEFVALVCVVGIGVDGRD